ncbi:tetratricopeptide repeat protein [Aquimonas voraii]|uniref:Tetratricopeptide repeat-containing protein n=1 Tax=Aquimonas voraii TaxID=265719 RepID=A0A1G6WJ38_9GAMM|nr:tetratricopeptide repeat protein [Aquimonas voraii]SDD65892.1 Tetratricopeptide repeat-containing protein [Aquimonas voraii]
MRTPLFVLKTSLLLALGLGLTATADAQRRGKQAEEEVLYPNATREEPTLKPVGRLQRQMKQMFDLSQEEGKEAQTEEASKAILAASAAGPYEKSFANQILAQIELDRDNYPGAIGYFQAALDAGGLKNNQYYQIMQNIGQLQFQEELYGDAAATFTRMLEETRAESAQIYALRGNSYYRMEQYEPAVADLRKAISLQEKPDASVSQLLMGSLFELGRASEAAEIAAGLLANDPQNVSLIRNLAAIYINAEETGKAIETMQGGIDRGVLTEERDYIELSKMYRYAEQDLKAAELITRALQDGKVQPSFEVYRGLGEAYYFSENIPQAAEAFGKADELATDGEMALNHARTLAELERWPETKAAANRAISKGVKRPGDAYVILGAAEFGLDNQPAAIAAYREAAKYPETKAMAESYLRQVNR